MERETVRRCRRCREPSVIIVNRWDTRLFGVLPMPNSEQTDHQCQSCGAGFSLRPPLLLWFALGAPSGVMFAWLGVLSAVGSLIALAVQGVAEFVVLLVLGAMSSAFGAVFLYYLAGPQLNAWRNPLVPGARMPELNLGPPQGCRSCSCGAPALRITQRVHKLIVLPVGTTFTYLCGTCSREFAVSDRWTLVTRSAMTLFFGACFAVLASLLPFEELRDAHFFVLGVLGLGAATGALLVALGIYQRIRHPVVFAPPTSR